MSITTPISNFDSTTEATATNTSRKTGNTMSDFDSFMQLLAAELQNQDPSNPVSNTEYISQMAQINSLQQLQTMGNSLSSSTAYSLIGKPVAYQTTDAAGNTTTGAGTVDSVITQNGKTYLSVNGKQVSLSDIQEIGAGDTNTQALGTLNNNISLFAAYSLIGKAVTYQTTDSDGKTATKTGTVDSVATKDNKIYLNIGDQQVDLSKIQTVGTPASGVTA